MPFDELLYEFDLAEEPGTFDIIEGEATRQHQELLLVFSKNDLKENPLTGADLFMQLGDEERSPGELNALIKKEFEDDGQTVTYLNQKNGKISTDGFYPDDNS